MGSSGMGFTKCYDTIKPALEERGYELSVYHSTGMSGRILERAIKEGYIDADFPPDYMFAKTLDVTGFSGEYGDQEENAFYSYRF